MTQKIHSLGSVHILIVASPLLPLSYISHNCSKMRVCVTKIIIPFPYDID